MPRAGRRSRSPRSRRRRPARRRAASSTASPITEAASTGTSNDAAPLCSTARWNRPARRRRGQQLPDAVGAGRLARHRHRGRVAAEGGDVVLDPLERGDLVEQAERAGAGPVTDVEVAGRVQAVVERDRDDAVARERRAVVDRVRARAVLEAAAVDPDEHGQSGRGGVRGPHVQVQAVVARRPAGAPGS